MDDIWALIKENINFIYFCGIGIAVAVIVISNFQRAPISSPELSTQNENNTSYNLSSKEYAAMGRELWSTFSCSTWASHFGDQKEAERLFLLGYGQGKEFLGAVRADKITEEDFRKEVPIGISMSLAGPSDDYILGVISTNVQDDALQEVFYTNYDRSKLNSDDLQKVIAKNKYRDGNCQFIGK